VIKTRTGSEKTLGQILIAKGVISQKQLDLALKIKDVQQDKYLGEILFQIGVPQEKINQALYYFRKRKTIGEILIDQELISSEQLEEALSKQKNIKEKQGQTIPLGLLLIEMGYINISGYLMALSKHFNMPILTLNNFEPPSHLQKVIGERYAMESRVIVLENNDTAIKLILAEPSMQIMEELRKAVPPGKMIEYYLASHSVIDEYFRRIVDFLDNTLTPKGKEPIGNEQQSRPDSNVLIISNANRRSV
jgi:MSHA biogenesis protein MshE